MVQEYEKKPPGDLTDDPWPSLNPRFLWNRYWAEVSEVNHRRSIEGHQKAQWALDEANQKRKQKELVESLKRRQEEEKEGKTASAKKAAGAAGKGLKGRTTGNKLVEVGGGVASAGLAGGKAVKGVGSAAIEGAAQGVNKTGAVGGVAAAARVYYDGAPEKR